ncbi:MAG TPA: two-component regulator propeller domain-containing protein [Kofleriaceae bacterium]|nr:two-component regulator propeller domain-containing protein [Kofleriaceae bacterium]
MVRHVYLASLVAFVAGAPASAAAANKTVQRMAAPLGCDRLTIAEGLPNSNVHSVVQDRRGFMWFGTQDGLARYDGTRMRVYRSTDPTSLPFGYVTALALDANGKLWIGTSERGVNLYDPDTDRFTHFASGTGGGALSSEGVSAIVRDRKDRIWFAMTGGGLNRVEPDGTFTKYLTKPLDVPITALAVDAAGNLWLGTGSDGVLRWNPDGGAPASRPAGDDRALSSAPISALWISSSGKVWIGSDGEGLMVLDPATGKVVKSRHAADDPGTLSDDHISTIFEDRSKQIWIGTANGLNRLAASGRMVRYLHDPEDPSSLSFNGVESVYQDAGGVMWIGGFTVGICKFDELRLKFGHYHTRNHVTSLFEDTDATLWVGTYNDGLYKYERGAQRVTIYHELLNTAGDEDPVSLEAAWITALHRDRRGKLWISLRGRGLVAFDTRTEAYRLYVPDPQTPNSLPVDSVFDIWEDDQGMLWLATWGAGLVRFDPQREVFTSFTTADSNGLSSNYLYTLYPDPTDRKILWLGAGKGGLVRFNIVAGTGTSFRHRDDDPASLSSDDVVTIYRAPDGIIWAGTYGGGLNRIEPSSGKTERFTAASSGLPNDIVLGILPDADGKLWMSTNGGGLALLDPKTRKFLVYEASDGLQNNEFSQGAYGQSAAGELIFGGPGGFNAFFPRDIQRDTYLPPVVLTAFKVFNQEVKLDRPIWTVPRLDVSYSDSFEVQFAALAFAAPGKNRYAYKIDGFDDEFIETDRPYATYTKIAGGNYTLRVRAANRHGVLNEAEIAVKLAVAPPFWRTWRAYGIYLLVLAGAVFLLFRYQRQRLRRAEREGRLAVVERDLELTGAVQTGFLPDHNEITTSHVQLFGLYRPADACGGDWWWHEPLPGGRHVVMVGDVTGHGPGPAMVTAAVATAFRVLIENGLDDVKRGLEMLNREVLRVAKGKYHMTMAALEIEEATGRWVLHSAGAPPILSLSQTGKHKVHFCAGAPLGTESGFETGWVEGQLEPTDRILIYTDGIPEIALPGGAAFGMRRFAQLFERTRGQNLRDASSTIAQHADQSLGGQAQADDWTFTLIEWGSNAHINHMDFSSVATK